MGNIKNEEFCAVCFRLITQDENVVYRVNTIENAVSNVCCMNCFHQMEEVQDDHC